MNVCEYMIRVKYGILIVRCWLPKDNKYQSFLDVQDAIYEFMTDLRVKDRQCEFMKWAKDLAEILSPVNAIEILDDGTGFGAIYYPEWP